MVYLFCSIFTVFEDLEKLNKLHFKTLSSLVKEPSSPFRPSAIGTQHLVNQEANHIHQSPVQHLSCPDTNNASSNNFSAVSTNNGQTSQNVQKKYSGINNIHRINGISNVERLQRQYTK